MLFPPAHSPVFHSVGSVCNNGNRNSSLELQYPDWQWRTHAAGRSREPVWRKVVFINAQKLRGRRNSSQKLAKRRTFVWGRGSRPFSQSKLKKKKWAARRLRALRSAGPCCKSTWAAQGLRCERVRRTSPTNAYKEKQVVEPWRSSPKCGWYLSRFAIDAESKTCFPCPAHQRYHTLATAAPVGQKPPLPPSFFPTRRRQACRSASSLLPAVQSGRRHCEIRSMRQQFIPPRRTWVLTRSDYSPTTCAPPLCSWQRWK